MPPQMAAVAKTCKVFLANTIATRLLTELKRNLPAVTQRPPRLTAFIANNDPGAYTYAQWSQKTCEENGFSFDLRKVEKEALEDAIKAANADKDVDGIMVYFPVFPGDAAKDESIRETIAMDKDVEGMRKQHLSYMYHNVRYMDAPANLRKPLLPCTPLGVVKILESLQIYNSVLGQGNRLYGKTVTVINRSEVIGRPLAALLANEGATVYSVDVTGIQLFSRGPRIQEPRHTVEDKDGWGLKDVLPISDVIISGVPSENYRVPVDLIREGSVCINFSSHNNFDAPAVKEKAAIYVPSVGKVTIAVLLRNLARLVENQTQGSATPALSGA